jgi:hypothetical protein
MDIIAGQSRDVALDAFCAACNKGPEVLFITESWITPRLQTLKSFLSDPLTAADADILQRLLNKDRSFADVLEWFEDHRAQAWSEFMALRERKATKHWLGVMAAGYSSWERQERHSKLKRESDGELSPEAVSERAAAAPAILSLGGGAGPSLENAKACYRDHSAACPNCGTAALDLRWVYFMSDKESWANLCGRAGWMTLCDPCRLRVDYFLEAMN